MAVRGANRRAGFWGERRAIKYLKKNGYKILEHNFKCPFGEVDIIASLGDITAFIEVKARNTDAFGAPREAVDRKRRKRYADSARFYFCGRPIDCIVRFDVIEVYKGKVNHILSAFEA